MGSVQQGTSRDTFSSSACHVQMIKLHYCKIYSTEIQGYNHEAIVCFIALISPGEIKLEMVTE